MILIYTVFAAGSKILIFSSKKLDSQNGLIGGFFGLKTPIQNLSMFAASEFIFLNNQNNINMNTLTIIILLTIFSIISFVYNLGIINAYWWHEYPILQDEKRANEVYFRSIMFSSICIIPFANVIFTIIYFFLTDRQKHGFRLTKF